MTCQMNQPEEKLSAALQELGSRSRQSAAPELGAMLRDEFRRHHVRRRRMIRLRIALVCLCVAGLAGLKLLKNNAVNNSSTQTNAVQIIPPQQVSPSVEVNISSVKQPEPPRRPIPKRQASTDVTGFWALPSFDLIPSGDRLRVVRMQMRGEDLRLIGAPIAEEIARRRVTADFVVGHDGTPYAVRLVQASF